MKIRLVRAELFHAGGRADMTKVTIAFLTFAKAPKNCISNFQCCTSKIRRCESKFCLYFNAVSPAPHHVSCVDSSCSHRMVLLCRHSQNCDWATG